MRNPSGPLPPRTYWRRRLVVLAALVAVVALVAWGCSLNSDAGQKNNLAGGSSPSSLPTIPSETSSSPTPTDSQESGTPTPSGSMSSSSEDPSGTASKSPKVRKKHGKRLCPAEDLRVTVRTDERYYSKHEDPKFTLLVVNIARSRCYVDVGSASAMLNVISGDDHVWSTADCPSGKKHKLRKFASGGVYTTSVRWEKTRSWQGCPDRDTAAKAGYYVLDARIGKAKPKNRAVFVLK